MTTHHVYFKLGVFIVAGLTVLVATIIILGSGAMFDETIPAETYFNESVQGLDVGAPVKYRGVRIGTVSKIDFVMGKYHNATKEATRYVLVEMKIKKKQALVFFSRGAELDEVLKRLTKSGLRVRLTTQGLTGVAFLEISFFDPMQNPPLAFPWEPDSLYLSSAPSTMSRLEGAVDAIGNVMAQFESINFKNFADTLDKFVQKLTQALSDANVTDIGQLLVQSLTEMREALKQANTLLHAPKIETILPNAAETMASARRITTGSEANLIQAAEQMRVITTSLEKSSKAVEELLNNPKLQASVDHLPDTLGNVKQASLDIRRALVELERLLRNMNDLVSGQRSNVGAILEETKTLIDNLNTITTDAKQNPSRILFGSPPHKINPEKLP